MNIRVERHIEAEASYVCSVEVPDDASAIELAIAVSQLARIASKLADYRCPSCFAPTGVFHNPECSLASDGVIEHAREIVEHGCR